MKIPIASINILLAAVLPNGRTVVGKSIDTHDNRNLYFVNPCTGSISMDEPEEQDLPCIPKIPTSSPTILTTNAPTVQATSAPTVQATNAPSITTASPTSTITDPIQSSPTRLPTGLLPTFSPTLIQTSAPTKAEIIDRYQCPEADCTFDFESGENSVQVQYHYTVETSSSVADPNEYLPVLEQKLLEKVANVMLAHCLEGEGVRRSLTSNQTTTLKRRTLHTVRRLAAIGVCSIPADEYLSQGKKQNYAPRLFYIYKC
jgi:hypothetical protein